jgi:hypothetical protein
MQSELHFLQTIGATFQNLLCPGVARNWRLRCIHRQPPDDELGPCIVCALHQARQVGTHSASQKVFARRRLPEAAAIDVEVTLKLAR